MCKPETFIDGTYEEIGILALCLERQDTINPGAEIRNDGCARVEESASGKLKPCQVGDIKIPHCDPDSNTPHYCFNGVSIINEGRSANKLMTSFLCTDNDSASMPPAGVKLTFGPCENEGDEVHHVDKLKCNCIRSSWVCQVE